MLEEEGEGLAEVLFSICWTPVRPQASPNCNDGPLACLCGYLSSWYARVTRQPCATHKSFSQWHYPKPSSFQGLVFVKSSVRDTAHKPYRCRVHLDVFLHLHYSGKLSLRRRFSTQVPRYFSLSKKNLYSFFN